VIFRLLIEIRRYKYTIMKIRTNQILMILFLWNLIFFISCTDKKYVPTNSTEFETEVELNKNIHDFGEVTFKDSISTIFEITNKGINPLVIQYVKSSCGCTIPEWTMSPIEHNKKGEIKVIYDAKLPGRFNKTISVFYNGKDSPKKLIIKGEVPYPKDMDSAMNQ